MGTTTELTFPRPSATDDRGNPILFYASNPPGVSFADNPGLNTVTATNVVVGTTMVMVIARDSSNNEATCSFELIVNGGKS